MMRGASWGFELTMADRSWLLNSNDESDTSNDGPAKSKFHNERTIDSDCDLDLAILELNNQINKVNELLRRNSSENSHRFVGRKIRYFDLDWEKIAQNEYSFRRRRDKIFSRFKVFSEPAWDILLDLFIAEYKGIRLPTSSVALGSGVPATTTLRWLGLLEEKGLIYREDDLLDGRRSFVRLSDLAISLIQESLADFYKSAQFGRAPLK